MHPEDRLPWRCLTDEEGCGLRRCDRWSNLLILLGIIMLCVAVLGVIYQTRRSANRVGFPAATRAMFVLSSPTAIAVGDRPLVNSLSPTGTPTAASSLSLPTCAPTETPTHLPTALATKTTASPTRHSQPPMPPSATRASSPTTSPTKPQIADVVAWPRVVIPKIGLSAGWQPVRWRAVETNDGIIGEWETVDEGIGYHVGSAAPGERGNVVMSAHSRPGGAFARLTELEVGDEIWLERSETSRYRYVVVETLTVQEVGASLVQQREHARYLAPAQDARLTLITCWPAWAYTHRLIVIARLQS